MNAATEILALDVGDRRIGVARANAIARLAQPLTTIDRNEIDPFKALQEIIDYSHPKLVVIGLPLSLNANETSQTKIIRSFTETFNNTFPGLTTKFQNETLSTKRAEQEIAKAKKPIPGGSDALAATYILQDYLDAEIGAKNAA